MKNRNRSALQAEQDRIDASAADWLVRRGEQSGVADEAFYAWLEADPRHGEAYDELARALEDVGELPHLVTPHMGRKRWMRRAALAGSAAAALIVAVLVAAPTLRSAPYAAYETAVAQTRVVELEDGSQITLGAHSRVRVQYEAARRRVVLESGEAFFDVAHDEARPFLVEAGGALVRVVGTRFDVHLGVEQVRISVQQGRVEVRDARALTLAAPAVRVLSAGQRSEVEERPTYVALSSVAPPVESTAAVEAGAWRDGRLAYDNARLEEIVADLNRYYAPGVSLSDAEAGDLRVTAAFRVSQIPAMLEALAANLPVQAQRTESGAYELRSAPSRR